jgi:hypothetical protein
MDARVREHKSLSICNPQLTPVKCYAKTKWVCSKTILIISRIALGFITTRMVTLIERVRIADGLTTPGRSWDGTVPRHAFITIKMVAGNLRDVSFWNLRGEEICKSTSSSMTRSYGRLVSLFIADGAAKKAKLSPPLKKIVT